MEKISLDHFGLFDPDHLHHNLHQRQYCHYHHHDHHHDDDDADDDADDDQDDDDPHLSCLQVILTGCSAHRGGITILIPDYFWHMSS